MASNEPAGDTVTRLQEAIDRLQEDVRRVEVWAGALSGFLKPVPGYDDEEQRHVLPQHANANSKVADLRPQPPFPGAAKGP
jgi:hypothetical protein